jgi:hypothetical protein
MNYLSQNKSDFRVLLFRSFQVNTKNDLCRVVELCADTDKTFDDNCDGISPRYSSQSVRIHLDRVSKAVRDGLTQRTLLFGQDAHYPTMDCKPCVKAKRFESIL